MMDTKEMESPVKKSSLAATLLTIVLNMPFVYSMPLREDLDVTVTPQGFISFQKCTVGKKQHIDA